MGLGKHPEKRDFSVLPLGILSYLQPGIVFEWFSWRLAQLQCFNTCYSLSALALSKHTFDPWAEETCSFLAAFILHQHTCLMTRKILGAGSNRQ